MHVRRPVAAFAAAGAVASLLCWLPEDEADAITPGAIARGFTARLLSTPPARFPGDVDSNSPALWARVEGVNTLHVFTSTAGTVRRSTGTSFDALGAAEAVTWTQAPEQGVWMEAVVSDEAGVWYGYYHNERHGIVCGERPQVLPRIGAARSEDNGRTWMDLGVLIEAPPDSHDCETTNRYFVGGVGDLSVMLDSERKYLYVFFSQFERDLEHQGVAVGRLSWADRDAPSGRLDVWNDGVWLPPEEVLNERSAGEPVSSWIYPVGTPLRSATRSWHAGEAADAFWGPAIHFNTALNAYVMLLNRASDVHFTQAGIYVSYNRRLDLPAAWSVPAKLIEGGSWYPQVMGSGPDGTDKTAGSPARFFMSGSSDAMIAFSR